VAEESASTAPNSTPKPKRTNNNLEAADIIASARSGKAVVGVKKRSGAKDPIRVLESMNAPQSTVEKAAKTGSEKASPGTKGKSPVTSKAKPTKTSKKGTKATNTPAPSSKKKAVPAGTTPPETQAKKVAEVVVPTIRKHMGKHLTDAQRRKVAEVLLGAKNKRAAALTKRINSHIRAVGENETRDALVKIIEDGKLSKSDAAKSLRTVISQTIEKAKFPESDTPIHLGRTISKLKIRGINDYSQIEHTVPQIRAVFNNPVTPPTVNRGLKEALQEAHLKRPVPPSRRPTLTRHPSRSPPRALTRSPSRVTRARRGKSRTGPLTGKPGFEIKTLDAADLELTPIIKDQPPVPNLAYGLDRVLFNPGVYHLQDPRSRVFNFDPYLQTIMPVEEFDFTALKRYITSSRDETLLATAREENKRYTGSTSSMTSALAHFHFLLSQWRPINTGMLSQDFPVEHHTFTQLQRSPSAVFLKWKDGVYAIDADKQFDTANILSTLGKSMEKLLTLSTDDFEKYRKEHSHQIPLEEREAAEPFNYTTMGDFLMRSQLDAHDPRLPGTGMFDLKTRAVVSIRMDVTKYEQGRDYEIIHRYGEYESYEREYYDMIRAAFLKYSLQVRMGRMDGIFVAFHNTQRIFGFQYISQPEMDLALHGTEDTTIGDAEFKLSLELLNEVLNKASAKYPEKSLRIHFETRDTEVPFMYIFVEPMEDEQIVEIQESNKAVIEEFEKRVLGLSGEGEGMEEQLSEEERKAAEWASMRQQVEETMEKDELDLEEARSLAESMIEESDIFGSEDISADEKEKLINDLLESSAFSDVEDEEAMVSKDKEPSREDGVEGASADSEGDNMEEDEDDTGEEDEEVEDNEAIEEDEESEEAEEDQEQDGEDEFAEESEEIEDSQSLEQADDKDLLVDEAPTDTTEVEALDTPAGPPESVDSIDENHDETNTDVGDITDSENIEPDIVENKELAPSEEAMESDAQDPDPASESMDGSDPETGASNAESNDPKASATEEAIFQHVPVRSEPEPELLAMTLTIRNKVNGQYVIRPNRLNKNDQWTIEYALEDVNPARAASLYQACKTRRARTLSNERKNVNDAWNNRFMKNLWDLSHKGKKWRERQNEIDSAGPLKVLDLERMEAERDSWGTRNKEPSVQPASADKE
jgi:hypothetical protein